MFEKANEMVQPHLTTERLIVGIIVLVVAWVIFLLIREFWCWFWKFTAIAHNTEWINENVHSLKGIAVECREELKRAKSVLERIADSTAANDGNRRSESGGNRAA
jgi:hypothetical protein